MEKRNIYVRKVWNFIKLKFIYWKLLFFFAKAKKNFKQKIQRTVHINSSSLITMVNFFCCLFSANVYFCFFFKFCNETKETIFSICEIEKKKRKRNSEPKLMIWKWNSLDSVRKVILSKIEYSNKVQIQYGAKSIVMEIGDLNRFKLYINENVKIYLNTVFVLRFRIQFCFGHKRLRKKSANFIILKFVNKKKVSAQICEHRRKCTMDK